MRKIISSVLLLSLFPLISFAEVGIVNKEIKKNIPLIINCDNYNTNENLIAEIDIVNKDEIQAGQTVDFSGILHNKNKYPVANVGVFVKIAKNQTDEEIAKRGIEIIDQFQVIQDRYISASNGKNSSTIKFDFVWNIPQNIEKGSYKVISYVTINNRFDEEPFKIKENNHSSLFNIESTNTIPAFFDRELVAVNGKKYNENNPILGDSPVKITFPIQNKSDKKIELNISFKHYLENIGNKVGISGEKIEYFSLEPNETKIFEYSDDSLAIKNYVVVELQYKDSKQFLNINYNRSGWIDTNITSLGFNSFPIKRGNINPIYICYKSIGGEEIKDAMMSISIFGNENMYLYSDSIKVDVDENNKGFLLPIKFMQDIRDATIQISINKGDEQLGFYSSNYSCSESLKGDCSYDGAVKADENNKIGDMNKTIIILITLLIFVITAIYFISHKKASKPIGEDSDKNTTN